MVATVPFSQATSSWFLRMSFSPAPGAAHSCGLPGGEAQQRGWVGAKCPACAPPPSAHKHAPTQQPCAGPEDGAPLLCVHLTPRLQQWLAYTN